MNCYYRFSTQELSAFLETTFFNIIYVPFYILCSLLPKHLSTSMQIQKFCVSANSKTFSTYRVLGYYYYGLEKYRKPLVPPLPLRSWQRRTRTPLFVQIPAAFCGILMTLLPCVSWTPSHPGYLWNLARLLNHQSSPSWLQSFLAWSQLLLWWWLCL